MSLLLYHFNCGDLLNQLLYSLVKFRDLPHKHLFALGVFDFSRSCNGVCLLPYLSVMY